MSQNTNTIKTSEKILVIAECLDLSQNSTEFLERFDETTEKAFDQILAKAILFPIAACASWARFISCTRNYYNKNSQLENKLPDILIQKSADPKTSEYDKAYWEMLAKPKSIFHKEKALKKIQNYLNKPQNQNKSKDQNEKLLLDLEFFNQQLNNQQIQQQELWNEAKYEIATSLIKAVTLTLTTACKLGATIAISAALPWVLACISVNEMKNSIGEIYTINKQYKQQKSLLKQEILKLDNPDPNPDPDPNPNPNPNLTLDKIESLTNQCKQLRSSRKKAILEGLTLAIVSTASIAFLATPIGVIATQAISLTAFAAVATLSLFKGGCFMQNMRSAKTNKKYLSKNISKNLESNKQNNNKLDKLDKLDKTKQKTDTKQEILESRMSHTDLLFGAQKSTAPKKDDDDSDGDGD